MRDLVVSDIHATPDELKDVDALMRLILESIKTHRPKRTIFLGDLHHTFAVTNVKVMGFYREWFKQLNPLTDVIALVGNHDMPGTGAQNPHALLAYEDLVKVVDTPIRLGDSLFLPYYADHAEFHKAVDEVVAFYKNKATPIERIYCHQEFNGAAYDNGFFAPHGADPEKMPVPTISGHIHTPQKLGKVWYPGAPRWRTVSDANIDRHIYLLDERGDVAIPTGDHCKRIWTTKIVEGGPDVKAPPKNDKDDFRFHVEGNPAYVAIVVADIKRLNPRAKVSEILKDKRIHVRESDGIDVAFKKYATKFLSKNGTPPERLWERAGQLLAGA